MNYRLLYFASLRDAAGCTEEKVVSDARDPRALYAEMAARHGFAMKPECLRIAVNGGFAAWDCSLSNDDEIAFLPPVSGG